MTFKLIKLRVSGATVTSAEIEFTDNPLLIRGPSDTGKSYIFQCILYCLGGGSPPESIPQAAGYDRILLEVENQVATKYTVIRGLSGGSSAIYVGAMDELDPANEDSKIDLDSNDFVRFLAEVESRVIVKKTGKKGPVTAGGLRHWILLSQTDIVVRSSVLGQPTAHTERSSTLSLIMTGNDDDAVEVGISAEERSRAAGGAEAIQEVINSLAADIPNESPKAELADAMNRVDATLDGLSNLQRSRADAVSTTRRRLAEVTAELRRVERQLAQSSGMLARFNLLDQKYLSDLQRLVGLNEGVAVFELLPDVPCPLCSTPIEQQIDTNLVQPEAAINQRRAFEAEAKKILALRSGLIATIEVETSIKTDLQNERLPLQSELERLSVIERGQIEAGINEFSVSIATLAQRRSELYSQIRSIEEIERLRREANRLDELSRSKATPISRALATDGNAIATKVLLLLHDWGFEGIKTVSFDASKFDMQIDGRTRTSFGQGTRALFLAAYFIALLEYCVETKRPHPGVLVIDSPLKNFSDARDNDDPEVSKATVKNRFYSWLSNWNGSGQLIIMENEPPLSTAPLHIVTFTGKSGEGRYGFFPEIMQDPTA
jgi:hypothetical protein